MGEQVAEGRGDDVDAFFFEGGETGNGGGVVGGEVVAVLVEVDGVVAERGVFDDPLEDVGWEEGLGPDTFGGDSETDEGVEHVAGVLGLGVGAVEGHGDGGWRRLEFWGEVAVAWKGVNERDVAFERHDCAAGSVEVCTPCWGAGGYEVFGGDGTLVETIHLSA